MGFFNRFFKKVEDVNKGESAVSELESEFYLESPVEEAKNFWVEIAQNIIVNSVKATNNTVERAFILVDMGEQPSFDIFYQIDGNLIMWHDLEDPIIKEKIESELLPQAPNVASAVNGEFVQARHPRIAFAELQFEWATGAWFSHIIWEDDDHAKLVKEEILSKWFKILSAEIKSTPLDSDSKLSWYP
ncbi:hypothetical protein U5N28_12525 [Lysinibacillus telephonicus]|uniref:Uncharacterized protein n=1 Tax=Lysinibacillus telephonicus TaxID=1714840 RepID=A0A431URR1_9BACI|nr:hypothetical protein [Lysinibacillus telephonicus]RTQ92990.1 hypothetical protein EKG35_10035 [Lysinibacillus telephonicus]